MCAPVPFRAGIHNVVLKGVLCWPACGGFRRDPHDAIVSGVTRQLCPLHDTGALVSAKRAYLDDPELARRHGQAGTERARRAFESEHVWALTREFYEQLP